MLPFLGKPILAYLLEDLAKRNAGHIKLLVCDRPDVVCGFIGKGEQWGLQVDIEAAGATTLGSVAADTSDNVTIGDYYRTNLLGLGTFPGRIDEVRIWNTNVSQATIQAWMWQHVTSSHPNYANLLAYYTFNEGLGSASADTIGNGYTANLSPAYAWVLNTNSLWNAVNGNVVAAPLSQGTTAGQSALPLAKKTATSPLTTAETSHGNSSTDSEKETGTPTVYQGLFYEQTGIVWQHSGAVLLSVDSSNAYSGTLASQGQGTLDPNNSGSAVIERSNNTTLNLSFAVASNQLSGTVGDGRWTATLQGEAVADGTNGPTSYILYFNGVQAGTLILSNNTSLITATMPDGTALNQECGLSATGQWPLYQDLYQGQGGILGWLEYDPTNVAGTAVWLPPGATNAVQIIGEPPGQ